MLLWLASMIEGMDKSLGDVLDTLERLGVAQETVVLFLSDNGSPSQCPRNLPLRGHKLTPYEGGIRVPMIVRWPGMTPPASICRRPVLVEDLFPSILEMAGLDWRGHTRQVVDGVSFVPSLKEDGLPAVDRALIWHDPHTYGQQPFSAIRVASWKLIYHHIGPRIELFDLEADIGETEDPAAKRPEVVADLSRQLAERLRRATAQMPIHRKTGQPIAQPGQIGLVTPSERRSGLPESAMAKALMWQGVAIEEPEFTLWGASPIAADGRYHLFAARWPEANVDPAWRKSSEIARYEAERPEGPFAFREVVLTGTGRVGDWDAFGPHNPEVRRFDDHYALLYIANSDFHQPPHPLNQQIGMMVARNVKGPWRKVGREGRILGPSAEGSHYTHGRQVTNPSLLKVGERFHLYFKTTGKERGTTVYGLAVADRLTGPYHLLDAPLTGNGVFVEDACAFEWDGKICLLTTDNHGRVTGVRGGGALWVSEDGLRFKPEWTQLGFGRLPRHVPCYDPERVTKVYGPDPKFERPKVLCEDGRPAWLYAPSGWNVTGGARTVCHVLRIALPEGEGPLSPFSK